MRVLYPSVQKVGVPVPLVRVRGVLGICKNGANVKCAYSEIGGTGSRDLAQYHHREEERQEGKDSDRYMGK